jgi:adenylosuccinate synthase
MPATVIVGLQWGDEGKGKATDFLSEQVGWVVRYQGGDNAGHTIVLGTEVFKLHLVPSGVLYPHIVPLIGPGVVVNPGTLIGELDGLAARGVDTSRVRVSHACHVIMPYHVAEDRASEARLGREGIGTTHRGIGPAYADRASRVGLRMEDLLDETALRRKLERLVPDKNAWLAQLGDEGGPFAVEALVESALRWGVRLREQIADTTTLVQDALRVGDHVLFEGAQGTLLDLDHGSYPFVTSSNPVAGGACTGGGIGPLQVTAVIGIMKAYSTRVGAGPYPTELLDEIGEGIATRGHEFGTTTGRRRRVGWFDAVPLRYAVDVNSVSSIILNKLDILSGIDEIRLCVAYDIDGRRVERWPASAEEVARAVPIYETFPGWPEEIHAARTADDLPPNARAYVAALAALAGVPITLVSVGPERTQTVILDDRPLAAGRG